MSFPPHVLRDWVQRQGVARYSAELAPCHPEQEVERLTSLLWTRVSVLSDMEVVLYLTSLLGPQAMADCLNRVLQQRARSTTRFGRWLPPSPAHAALPCRPCPGPGQGLPAQPSSVRPSLSLGVSAPARALDGVPPLAPARAPLTPAGPPPPAPASCLVGADRRPRPFVPAGPPPATPVRDPRTIPVWPMSAPTALGERERGCTEVCSPVWSSHDSDASSSDDESTPRRPTRGRLDL